MLSQQLSEGLDIALIRVECPADDSAFGMGGAGSPPPIIGIALPMPICDDGESPVGKKLSMARNSCDGFDCKTPARPCLYDSERCRK